MGAHYNYKSNKDPPPEIVPIFHPPHNTPYSNPDRTLFKEPFKVKGTLVIIKAPIVQNPEKGGAKSGPAGASLRRPARKAAPAGVSGFGVRFVLLAF